MPLISILTHLGDILALMREIQTWVQKAAERGNVPSASETKPVVDAVRKLLDSGVIQIQGVDDAKVSASLKLIEDQLCPPSA